VTIQVVVTYFVALVTLYLLVQVLYIPARLLILLVYNGILGGLALWIINLLGQFVEFHVGLNPITALIAGLLGIPGVVALVFLRTMVP